MKTLLKKYRNYLVIGLANIIMIGYTAVLLLAFLKLGSYDDWKIANYCSYNINSSILDASSSIKVEGDTYYFSYDSEQSEYHYLENIRFSTKGSGASIGGYGYDTYIFKGKGNIEISFTLNNVSIYKLQFNDIKVSNIEDDSDPTSLTGYKLSHKDNRYKLSYSSSENIYIYSVSLLYLVKK